MHKNDPAVLIKILLFCFLLISFSFARAQAVDSIVNKVQNSVNNINVKLLKGLQHSYSSMQKNIEKKNNLILKQMQQQEIKLQKKLSTKDSVAARQEMAISHAKYEALLKKLQSPQNISVASSHKAYIPGLDSVGTIMKLFQSQDSKLNGLIPQDKLTQIQSLSSVTTDLQNRLNQSADIEQFINERKQSLQQIFKQYGLENQLLPMKKQMYYYQQQVKEYNDLLHDENKLEEKLICVLREQTFFRDFMQQNSFLARLFPMPAGYGTAQALVGLQTRNDLQQQISQLMGSAGGGNSQQFMQSQMQGAQTQIDQLKNQVSNLGGGSSDVGMPEFKPNNQKTKSFLKRLEYGLNIQSQKTNYMLPATSDIALTVGYKISDNASMGVGAGYKLGWGQPLKDISFSSQGINFRTYIDIKLVSNLKGIKGDLLGNWWISGGYEKIYLQAFSKIPAWNDFAWQTSGLIGMTKKTKIKKNKETKIQLLYDILYKQHIPQTQPIVFRMGWGW